MTAVVGAGVLGLPYQLSFLGWGWGLTMLTVFCGASMYTSYLLAALHEGRAGQRRNTYRELGQEVLGALCRAALRCTALGRAVVCSAGLHCMACLLRGAPRRLRCTRAGAARQLRLLAGRSTLWRRCWWWC